MERSEEAFPQPGLSRPRVLWALRRDVTDSVKGVIAIVAMALSARAVGRRVSGLSYYRRAATYYATALYRVSGATDHSPKRELELRRRQRACWERIVDLQPVPRERISIPYAWAAIWYPDAAA